MIGVLGWPPASVWPLTLRELVIAYESKAVNDWDHTAMLAATSYNVGVIVAAANGNKKAKAKTANDFHPHRRKQRGSDGMRITPENFTDLQMIGDALSRG